MTVFAALEYETGGLSNFQREFGRDHPIGTAADAIRAEILARHAINPSNPAIPEGTDSAANGGAKSAQECQSLVIKARAAIEPQKM